MINAQTPCVWGRVTCHGQKDADGQRWDGCGVYDIAATDTIILREIVRQGCRLCGNALELAENIGRGSTAQKLPFFSRPIPNSSTEWSLARARQTPRKPTHKRTAYLHKMENILTDDQPKHSSRTQQRPSRRSTTRAYVSSRRTNRRGLDPAPGVGG